MAEPGTSTDTVLSALRHGVVRRPVLSATSSLTRYSVRDEDLLPGVEPHGTFASATPAASPSVSVPTAASAEGVVEATAGAGPSSNRDDGSDASGDERPGKRARTEQSRAPTTLSVRDSLARVAFLSGCRSVDEYEHLNHVDEGAYGVVIRARDRATGDIVALKRVKMDRENDGFPRMALREITHLLACRHANIVSVREIVVGSSNNSVFMVMEFMEHDLRDLMSVMPQAFTQSEVKCLMQQLLRAVVYMHDRWILHRDLKTSNLLLNNKGVLKVADFGMAREYGSPVAPYTPLVITLWYRAPELLLGATSYSTAVDVWACGCILGELLAREPLLPGQGELDQIDRIFRLLGTPSEAIWPGVSKLPSFARFTFRAQPYNKLRQSFPYLSDHGLDLLNRMLTYDPSQRISAADALAHPWFSEAPLPKSPAMMPTWPSNKSGGKSYDKHHVGLDKQAMQQLEMTRMLETRQAESDKGASTFKLKLG